MSMTIRHLAAAALAALALGLAACGGNDDEGGYWAGQAWCPNDPAAFVGPVAPECLAPRTAP